MIDIITQAIITSIPDAEEPRRRLTTGRGVNADQAVEFVALGENTEKKV
jgi:hypothetical protein